MLVKLDRVSDAIHSYELARQLTSESDDKIEKSISYGVRILNAKAAQVYSTDPATAIAYYDKALQINNNYHDSVYWRANALTNTGQYEQAVEGFKRSIELYPMHFESYQMYDYVLAREYRWDEIIAGWDKFLALVPDHAGAYLERSGTHYHNGNHEQSRADLKRACELDSQRACSIQASFLNQ